MQVSFLLCLFLSTALSNAFPNPEPRIKNGNLADPGEYPFAISIKDKVFGKTHHCGGSIINSRWVLTACHCVHQYYDYQLEVLAGTNNLNGPGEKYDIIKIVENQSFQWGKTGNDTALLKVARPFNFTNPNIAPVELELSYIPEYVEGTAVGWGRLSEDSEVPDDLYELEVKTVSHKQCKDWITTNKVDKTELCTYASDTSGVCFGDSGGPLVMSGTNKQIGVLSWVVKCGEGFPDVFTRVQSFVDWIYLNSDSWK